MLYQDYVVTYFLHFEQNSTFKIMFFISCIAKVHTLKTSN